jgi:uncharacterized protein
MTRRFVDVLCRLAGPGGPRLLFALGLLTLFFAAGYARLEWTRSAEVLTLEGSTELAHYKEWLTRWGSDELIVLAYETPDAFAPAELLRLRELTDALLDVEGVAWVSSLDTAFTIDTGPFGPYARGLVPDDLTSTEDLRAQALANPFVRDRLVSADGQMLLLAVQLEGSELDNDALEARVLAGIERVLAAPAWADTEVLRAGSPVFNQALAELTQRDQALFTPLVVVVIAVCLSALFMSAVPTLLALAVVLVSVVWTLGLMGWLGIPMNITTSLLPPLLMVIAVTDAIHMISGQIGRLAAGDSRADALRWTLDEVLPACFWTCVTTAFGFASLVLVQIDSVRQFGLFSVIGVCVGFFHTVVLLPALLLRVPLERSAEHRRGGRLLAFCMYMAHRPLIALAVLVVCMAVSAVGIPRLEVATHDGEFFRASHPINRAYRAIEREIEGVTPFEVELAAPSADALRAPASIRAIAALQDELDAIPELSRGISIVDLLRAASPDLDLADDAAVRRSLFLLETLAPTEVAQLVRRSPPLARISARAVAMTSARTEALLAQVTEQAAHTLPAGWSARPTGLVPVFAQMEQYLVEGQLGSYGLAVLGIAAAFLVIFRSPALVLAALVANVIPTAVAGGILGLAGIRLDVATIMVGSVALGISVDDTIHLLRGYQQGLRECSTRRDALARALDVSGRAALLTSLVLILGFAALVLSGFQPTAHFGLGVALSITTAMAGDLVVLPALLLWIGEPRGALEHARLEGALAGDPTP